MIGTPAEYGRGLGPDIDPDPDPIDEARNEELDAIPVEPEGKAKRKRGQSPTSRCLAECRKRGWIAGVVERFVKFPPPGHHVDLFGVIDIVAAVPPRRMLGPDGQRGQTVIEPGYILGIQASPGSRHGAHRTKILAEPRARDWLDSGGRLELWSWDKRGAHYERPRWTLRIEAFTRDSWPSAPDDVAQSLK